MTTQYLIESVEYLKESFDPDTRTVKQIIIKAGESKNKRNYPKTVLQEAVFLFENSQTYRNHPTKRDIKEGAGRKIEDLTGWLTDVQFDEGMNGLVGMRHFTNNAAGRDAFQLVADVIEGRAPATLLGGSINAIGKGTRDKDGSVMVEAITQVLSVDDVTVPAAGGGFEKLVAGADGGIVEAIFREMDYMEWFDARPDYTKRLQNEMKSVRQDEAVKGAQAQADQLQATVDTLQAQNTALQEQLEAAQAKEAKARRELLVVETLHKVRGLPAEWRDDLRQKLVEADESRWDDIIRTEQHKAKRVKPKTEGAVHTRRVAEDYTPKPTPMSNRVKADETFEEWQKRTNRL